jgi:BASS family bile acid:Na+ symporter
MWETYAEYEYLLAQIQLVLFMLGMGATLAPRDFVLVASRPRFLVAGATCQFVLTPLLAVVVNRCFDLGPGFAVGLILVSAMPGGQMSKLFTYLARGNVALSISLTACGTLASLVTVPLLLELLAEDYLRGSNFEMPVAAVIRDVTLYLVLPLAGGMALGRLWPERRRVFSKSCIRVGLVFVAVMVTASVAAERATPGAYGWKPPVAILVFCVGAMQLSMLPFRLMQWPPADCVAVGIEVTMRNINLALLLKALLFPPRPGDAVGEGVLYVILYYGGTALVAGAPLAWRFRRKLRPAESALNRTPVAANMDTRTPAAAE